MSAVELTLRIISHMTGASTTIASRTAAARMTVRRIALCAPALPLQQAGIGDDEDEADERDDEGNRRPDTRLEIGESPLVDQHAHRLGGAERAAARHDPDDVEYLYGVDRSQYQRHHERAGDVRKRYRREAAEDAGAVDMGGVVEIPRRRLQRGKHDQADDRKVLPDIGDTNGIERQRGIAQPTPIVGDHPGLLQQRVEGAEIGRVDEPPRDRVHHRRYRPGYDE